MDKNLEIKVLAGEKDLVFRQGDAQPIYQYNGFRHEAYSTDSFIALIKNKASKSNAVIAYSETGIVAILDDSIIDREQDRVIYNFKFSQQYLEWSGILKGISMEQKAFLKFLQRREPNEIADIESLIAKVQQIKYVKTISGELAIADNNNYTFAIQVGDAESTVRIPQIIDVNMEIYNESGLVQPMEIEVEINLPSRPEEKLSFNLQCPKLARYMREAVESEIAKVNQELDGYLIVTGKI